MARKRVTNIKVSTLDADLEFPVKPSIKGKELFELICRTLGLRESWYFGLQFRTSDDENWWLRMDEKVVKQISDKDSHHRLSLVVQFYPEDVEEELIQEITQHLFFLQIREAILNMDIYCPAEASVLLASYALQAKYGDYDEEIHEPGFLADEQLLPKRTVILIRSAKEMLRCEAETEYLKIVQDLDMYGISYYKIKNKKQTELWLGIHSSGINIYNEDNTLTPVVSFTWSETKHLSFRNKKFTIHSTDKGSSKVVFYSSSGKINRQILNLCVGNHDLYMRRRRPDSMEIQQMRAQAKEEKARRKQELTRYLREREAREEAVRERDELRNRLEEYQDELENSRKSVVRAEETTDLLAEKARVAEEEASLLLQKAADLEAEISRLTVTVTQKEEEKVMLESHIREAEFTIRKILEDSENRSNEAVRLQEELQQARQAENIAKHKLLQLTAAPHMIPMMSRDPSLSGSVILESDDSNVALISREIQKERVEYLQKSSDLQKQLTELKSEIESLKVAGKLDMLDQIHTENIANGGTKYSTLRKITESSTDARVQFFEKL